MEEIQDEEAEQIAGGTYQELRALQELLNRIREFGRISAPTIDRPIIF